MIVTYEAVLKEIEQLSQRNPDGFTVAEMSDALDRGFGWCRRHIRKLMDEGKIRYNGKKTVTRIDGARGYAPVYVFNS